MSGGALRELLAKFDVDTGTAVTKLKGLDGAIGGAKAALGDLATGIVGAFSLHAAKDFIKEQIEIGSKINDTSEKLGVSAEELQKWQYAAKLSGVEGETAAKGLQFLNKNLGEAIGGNADAAKTFAELGVNLADVKDGSKSATDLLPGLADKFAACGSDAERTALAMKIFGKAGAAFIPILKQGSPELKKMAEEFAALGGGMDDDFIKMADKAGDEIDKLKFTFQGLKSRIAVEVLPTITEWVIKLQHGVVWIRHLTKETNIVRDALALMGIVGSAAALKSGLAFARMFGILKNGGTLASLGQFGLILAAIAAIVLVVDDLATAFEGGDSAIQSFLEETLGVKGAKQYIDDLKAAWNEAEESVLQIKEPLKDVLVMLADLAKENAPAIIFAFDYIARVIGTAISSLATFIALLLQLPHIADDGFTKNIDKILGKYTDTLFGKEAADGKSYGGFWGETKVKPSAAPPGTNSTFFDGPSYLNPNSPDFGGGKGAQVSTTVTIGEITVVGSADPKATAAEVAKVQRGTFENATQDAAAALARGPGRKN